MVPEDLLFLTSAPQALHAGMRLRVGQVIGCVGGGSTGYVYRVQDEIGGLIAVREYFPGAVAMRADGMVRAQPGRESAFEEGQKLFDEDGWQLAAQDHPGLVKAHQVWSERGTSYLAMPWCEGHTLGQIVRASPVPPSQAQLCIWLRAMADALTAIHRRRGLHGNLSLDQVMLLGSGRLLLMEFARARRAVARDPRDIERDPFAALECGTDPRCGPMGPWTDIYALAAMLHFALRGRAPQAPVHRAAFDAQEPLSQIKALLAAGFSEDFLHGIDRGLALRARARPQSLPEFLVGLGLRERRSRQRATSESLLINLPVSETPPSVQSSEEAVVPVAETVTDAIVVPRDDAIDITARPADAAVAAEVVEEPAVERAETQPEFDASDSALWADTEVPVLTEPVQFDDDHEDELASPPTMPGHAPHFARPQGARRSTTLVIAWLAGLGAVAAFGAVWLVQADLGSQALSKIQLPTPAEPLPSRDGERTAGSDAASQALSVRADSASSPIPEPLEATAAGPMRPAPPDAPAVEVREPSAPAASAQAVQSVEPAAAPPRPSNARSGAKAKDAKAPVADAPAPATRVIEDATDASALSRRCPELLARQYTGPPLSASEREQVRTQCR